MKATVSTSERTRRLDVPSAAVGLLLSVALAYAISGYVALESSVADLEHTVEHTVAEPPEPDRRVAADTAPGGR